MDWMTVVSWFMEHIFYPLLSLVLTAYGASLLASARAWFKRKTAESRHLAKAEIFFDAVEALLPKFIEKIKDGKLTADEKAQMLQEILQVCRPKVVQLTGVAWEEFVEWAKNELEIVVGKLKRRLGMDVVLPDDEATTGQ